MKSLKLLIALIAVVLFGGSALANKRIYTARLSTGNEVHQVVGSNARGSALVATNINGDGYTFQVVVRGLSGQPFGVHLHAPAPPGSNAPVIITLCGNPAPAAVTPCPSLDSDGIFAVQGLLTSALAAQWMLTSAQFVSWAEAGSIYVNVHTTLNPAGEVRGQLEPL
jgi:hypothetical protein